MKTSMVQQQYKRKKAKGNNEADPECRRSKRHRGSAQSAEASRAEESEGHVPMDADPLAWLYKNGSQYPRIQCVAWDVLCVPASSASVERLFSRSGLTCTQLRNKLDPKLVEKIMWLVGNE